MEVVVFSPRANTSNIHGARSQRQKMERKTETKIVTALMFSYSGKLKTWIKCQGSNTPPPPHSPPLHMTDSVDVPKRICDFLHFLFSVYGIYR